MLGEVDKWIAVSEQRFVVISVEEDGDVSMLLRGAAKEIVTIAFLVTSIGTLIKVSCTFPDEQSQPKEDYSKWDNSKLKGPRYDGKLPPVKYLRMFRNGTCA